MATVKGDVHDIGKNIVGVVLACNNYEVIDLGVMVPVREDPRPRPRERGADAIGLSGLITPSLDEMVHVAKEMTRTGFTVPLLIGGATTSAAHTAVKIAPEYAPGRRARPRRLAGRQRRQLAPLAREQAGVHVRGRGKAGRSSGRSSRRGGPASRCFPWRPRGSAARGSTGRRPTSRARTSSGPGSFAGVPLSEIVPYIDWGPFFSAWELHGRFPDILADAVVGSEATQALRRRPGGFSARIVAERRFTANAVIGFWPCNARRRRRRGLRRRGVAGAWRRRSTCCASSRRSPPGQSNLCLADFVAPRESGRIDYIGGFAVTSGHGVDGVRGSVPGGVTTTTTRS